MCAATPQETEPPRKNVLVLLPENLGSEGQMTFVQNLSAALDVPDKVELFTESIDLAQLKNSANTQELAKLFALKYKHVPLDLIIAGQRPLLEFLLKRPPSLFPKVPILFAMIPKNVPIPTLKYPGVTGSDEALDFAGTVKLALTLQPQTKRVVVLSGVSARDDWLKWIALQQFRSLFGRVQFAFWDGLTPQEAKERFHTLSADDVLLYLAESQDHVGYAYSPEQFLERILPACPVAVYSPLSQALGHGIVGGNIYDNSGEARIIAQQAKEILSGKSTEDIPIADVSMIPAVDWRQLDRWHIPSSRIPPGTDIHFRESTLWEKYKFAIVSVFTFIALETILLFLLWVQVRRTSAARRMVERRFATERVVMEYSRRFTHCPPEEVDTQIQQGLAAVRKAKELEWALWCTLEPGTLEIAKSFVSLHDPVSLKGTLRLGAHTPWLLEQIDAGHTVALSTLSELPKAATNDRRYLESLGIKSLLLIGAASRGDTRSALLLASREHAKQWPGALVARLAVIGNLFGAALHRRSAEVELKDKKEWLDMALEASNTALWDLDVVTGKVRWSQRDDSMVGKAPMELELTWEKFLERVPPEDRDDLYRRAVARLEDQSGNDTFLTEWRYHEPAGRERWVLFRGRVYRDARGWPLRLRGVNVDITELKQAKLELVELTERLIQAQETERQRLARELHDDIGQRLSLLIMGLDRLRHGLPSDLPVPRAELSASLDEANQLATDIHALSHQLHSSKLKHLGLKSALRELCARVSRQHGIEVRLNAGAIPGELSEERALCLYRVAQEALNNAVKHSGSAVIEVELAALLSTLRLTVTDHGTGFDVHHHAAGVGLASMRERTRMVAGKFHISSTPGQGTEIVTEVALQEVAKHASTR